MQRVGRKARNITTDSYIKHVPFSEDIRNFISVSRSNQTFFANLEGSYQRRILTKNDKDTLKEFVYCTLYYNKIQVVSTEECNHINNIADKIISLSQKYFKDEVHFSSIWLFCYEYSSKTTRAIPLFKLYKTAYGKEAAYIDENLKVYTTWDHYIENAEFPVSFLCVPRYGEYHVLNNAINVEYISKYKTSVVWTGSNIFKPYSLKTIFPWIEKYTVSRGVCDGLVLSVCSALQTAWHILNPVRGPILILFLNIFIRLSRNGYNEITCKEILRDLLMFGNQIRKSSCLEDLFKNFPVKSADQCFNDVPNKLLGNVDNSNLSQSFKKFAEFLADAGSCILPQLTGFFPNNTYLKILTAFLRILKFFQYEVNHREQTKVPLSALTASEDVSGDSDGTVEKLGTNTEIMLSAIEKLALNLTELREAPFANVLDKFYKESAKEVSKESVGKQTLPNYTLYTPPSGNEAQDFLIYFHSPSFLQVLESLKNLFGDGFRLAMGNNNKHKVLDSSGLVVGYVFCLEESSIFGYFSFEKRKT